MQTRRKVRNRMAIASMVTDCARGIAGFYDVLEQMLRSYTMHPPAIVDARIVCGYVPLRFETVCR